MSSLLETLIRQHVNLVKSNSGWEQCLCKICNDHGHKGLRAGFKFSQNEITYNCFNCNKPFSVDLKHNRIPKKVINYLKKFGLEEIDIRSTLPLINLTEEDKEQIKLVKSFEPEEIDLPKEFERINFSDEDVWSILAKEYLLDRKIDIVKYPDYYICRNPKDSKNKRWTKRLIIPYYKNNKLIYYTGRDLLGTAIKKYINCSVSRDNILFNFDLLKHYSTEPIYVTEGIFDAMMVDGIAVLSNKLTDSQIHWLNSTDRTKIIIPDRYGSGYVLANQAINQGWNISLPDMGDCKDINEAVQRYGKLYVQQSIVNNTFTGSTAEIRVKVLCR